ncbi:MAG TPA: hypothetical protein VH353_11630 [Caulobacteraceae bacterium]|nr:hypothetical protein [Caulobacteraceae bacterium]
MNDLQARLADPGEAERGAAFGNSSGLGSSPGDIGAAGAMDDPMRVHAAIAATPPGSQAIVLQRLRLIDQIAQAIRGQTNDPVERARMAQHIAQMHPEMGIDPGVLTPQAMSDENIAALHELAVEAALKVALANLHAKAAAGGVGATGQAAASDGSAGTGENAATRTPLPPASRTSHAAKGFTLLGVA